MIVNQLKGEVRPLVIEINGEPLAFRYCPKGYTLRVIQAYQRLEVEGATLEERAEALNKILVSLVKDWDLYDTEEDQKKKKNARPVTSEIISDLFSFDVQNQMLAAINEDRFPNPTSGATSSSI